MFIHCKLLLKHVNSLYITTKTHDITSTKQMAIYETFKHNCIIAEHFLGIIPTSELAEIHLNAKKHLAIKNYLQSIDISLLNAKFFLHRYD